MKENALLRLEKLFGKENITVLQNVKILVAGLGGVGGFALEALVRCGIERFVLFDADTFEESNLNRQILSTEADIGSYKTDVAKRRILAINPSAEVETHPVFLDENNIDEYLSEDISIVIDAIDSVSSKCYLIKKCVEKRIKVVSSMGAALRFDPTRVTFSDISKTSTDPLARAVRRGLKQAGVTSGVMCVYSNEVPQKKEGMLGSFVSVVGTFGLTLASLAIQELLKG